MIIIAYKPGQLANRLFLFAKFLAYSYEHHVSVINPSFDDYAAYFTETKGKIIPSSHGWSGFSSKFLINVLYTVCFNFGRVWRRLNINSKFLTVTYLEWSEQYDLDSNKKLSRGGVHFIQGWDFHAKQLMGKYRLDIVHFFRPNIQLQNEIDSFFSQIKKANRLIGVHIRHGDYQFFEGGKYFYDVEGYKGIMKSLVKQNSELDFLVCTNNKSISKDDFEELPVTLAPGHEVIDLYLLAKCDYIIGPPSTYSMWASFYGNVPLYQIKELTHHVDWSDFKLTS